MKPDRTLAHQGFGLTFLKVLLFAVTVFTLMSAVSFGAFVAPFLLPFLWFAAASASRWMRFVWILLATLCAWLFGILVLWTISTTVPTWIAIVFALLVGAAYVATTGARETAPVAVEEA